MPAVPRFRRTEPTGPVTKAPEPIPVLATIRWHAGHATEEQALAALRRYRKLPTPEDNALVQRWMMGI